MIKTTQADVLNKIVPQKDKSRGVYTASVPSQEILSYVYNTTLPSGTETFENLIDNLQTETRSLFSLKKPHTPKNPTVNSFNNCNGRWAEYLFSSYAWNKLADINISNVAKQIPIVYVYVKLPDYKESDTKWTSIFKNKYQTVINDFDRDSNDPAVSTAGHNYFTLYASNPDGLILKYTMTEYQAIAWPLDPFTKISGLDMDTQNHLDAMFKAATNTVTPSVNLVSFLSMKNSIRPDRKYQFVREGDNIKAHLMYLIQIKADKGLDLKFLSHKYYAVSFKSISQQDKNITDIASSACVASGLIDPIWSVDALLECLDMNAVNNVIERIVSDNK